MMMAKSMKSNIFNFLGPEVCSKNILTQGYPSTKQGKRHKKGCAVLAFANDPHVDKCDLLSDDIQSEWMTEVTDMLSKSEESEVGPFVHRVCKKVVELKNTFGLGLPTTCVYAYCVMRIRKMWEVIPSSNTLPTMGWVSQFQLSTDQ